MTVLLHRVPAVGFARERLQRSGNLHESEVFAAFRRSIAKYRSPEAMPDDRIRDFVRNWAPDLQRTPNGYLKVGRVCSKYIRCFFSVHSRGTPDPLLDAGIALTQKDRSVKPMASLCSAQGVSLQQRVDPFSGAPTGTAAGGGRSNATDEKT